MSKLFTMLPLSGILLLAGCGGGSVAYVGADVPPPVLVQARYEYLRHPTINGLEYINSINPSESHLTTAAGGYVGYTGGDTVTFVLGDIVLFTMPGDPPVHYTSLYDGSDYQTSVLHSDTAVENLMAFLMAIDDDGNYGNGIQIAAPIRVAARGMRVNFNQSAYAFYTDPAVQFAVSVLSSNTLYGARLLPTPADAVIALRTP